MDLCVVDWGDLGSNLSALATFFAGSVALWIFTQWRGQKGAEVLANEAKLALNEIYLLNESLGYFIYQPADLDASKALYMEKLKYIKNAGINLNMRLIFISENISDENFNKFLQGVICSIRSLSNEFDIVIQNDIVPYVELLKHTYDNIEDIMEDLYEVSDFFRDIAMYKFKLKP